MDFLDPDKKRAHTIRLFIGYCLVAVAIAMATIILLFQSYGYDVDRRTGQIIQNGLLYVSAKPESTSIILNGTQIKSRTDAKLTIPSGAYTIELKRDGYRTWKRAFNLDGGSIERLSYPMLFPEKLTTTDVQLYSSLPSFATISLDRHWLLIQRPGTLGTFDNFDLNDPNKPPTTLTLPTDLLTATTGDHKLTNVAWAGDNRRVLIRHNFSGGFEFIEIDRETPANSLNITRSLTSPHTEITLRDKRFDQLYVYDAASRSLQSYDEKAKATRVVLQNVISFKSNGAKDIYYVTDDGKAEGDLMVKFWDGDKAYTLRTFPRGTEIRLDLAKYDNDTFAVLAVQGTGKVLVYKNPKEAVQDTKQKVIIPVTILKIDQVDNMAFSDNSQFIMLQDGGKFATYDIETDRRYYYELKQPVAHDQLATWMDGHRLVATLDGKIIVMDYDGSNQQQLAVNDPAFKPYFNGDYTSLLNIAPSVVVPGRYALTQTSMKLSQ